MIRRTLILLRVLVLLIAGGGFVGTLVLWQRSYAWDVLDTARLIYIESPSHRWMKITTSPGTLDVAMGTHSRSVRQGWTWIRRPSGDEEMAGSGFSWVETPRIASLRETEALLSDVWGGSSFLYPATVLRLRFWIVALAFALVFLVPARRLLMRWMRKRRGKCTACGYDLRATPGVCPECGATQSQMEARHGVS